jgi:DNA replication protein DnaC
MDSLYSAALMTEVQKRRISLRVDEDGTDLEQFKQLAAIENDIVNFINEGKNLYLHSANCGNGKSSWSIRLAQAYFNKIWVRTEVKCRVLFISVPRYLLAIKDNISNKNAYAEYIKENVLEADLVIFDDLAAKMGSEFELTHLLNIIDNRISLGKSNIYTSNLNRQQLYNALGERLTSRVANMSIDIELRGADKRVLTNGGQN